MRNRPTPQQATAAAIRRQMKADIDLYDEHDLDVLAGAADLLDLTSNARALGCSLFHAFWSQRGGPDA